MIDRRRVLAALPTLALPKTAAAEAADRWIGYEARLRSRLSDAGGGAFLREYAAELLKLNNAFRAAEGAPPLADDPELARAAEAHAADMTARSFFAHKSPYGFEPGDRAGLLVRSGMGAFGENIAFATHPGGAATAREAFQGWRDSPPHRQNMLRPQFTHAGHGVARKASTWISVAVFADFNARLASPLPFRADGAALKAAMTSATPRLDRYKLSDPEGPPQALTYQTAGAAPTLPAGAWRLRPLRALTATRYEVLWGPIFVV